MKHILVHIFVILLFWGCNGQKSNKTNISTTFDLIDVTIEQEIGVLSLRISETGKTYIRINENRNESAYYTFNIGEKEIDSVNYLVRQIKQTKIDTLYTANCVDCGSYRIIIKSKDIIIKTKVENFDNPAVCLKKMNELVSYLDNIARTSKKQLEKNFIFESKTREFDSNRFIPPPRE